MQFVQLNSNHKWSSIANELFKVFGVEKRTGKQCRERWHNHLNPQINKAEWTAEEKSRLFWLHKTFGNRWSKISESMPGRTENSIKNCFYSLIRKNLRKYNRKRTESEKIKGSIKSLLKRDKFREILLETELVNEPSPETPEKSEKTAVEIIKPQVVSLLSPMSLVSPCTTCSSSEGLFFNFDENLYQNFLEHNFSLLAMSPQCSQIHNSLWKPYWNSTN